MSIEKFIAEKTQQKSDIEAVTEAITLRLQGGVVAEIDELASSLEITRHELMIEFIADSLKRAQEYYEKVQNKPESVEQLVDDEHEATSEPRYIFLNTNKRNDPNDHAYMVSNGIAAAFYDPWKFKINSLRKGDVVFLYESGVGIVAVGKASGVTDVLDKNNHIGETHQQKLSDYRKVNPLSARKIKKLTGTNMRFLQTMFKVKSDYGVLIEDQLK